MNGRVGGASALFAEEAADFFAEEVEERALFGFDVHGLSVFDDSDGGGVARVLENRSRAGEFLRDGGLHGHIKDFFRDAGKALEERAAAGEEDSRPDEIEVAVGVAVAADEVEKFANAGVDDLVETGAFDLAAGEARVIFEDDGIAGNGVVDLGGTLFDFETFGAGDGNAEADGDIVGDVIATDGENAGMRDGSVDVDDVIGGATADIEDEGTEVFLVLVEDDLGGGEGIDDDILDFDVGVADAAERVLNAGLDAVDDVEIGFEFVAEHADRVEDTFLFIDVVVLEDGVNEPILVGNADLLRTGFDILNVFLVDFAAVLRDLGNAAIVEGLDVGPGDGDPDAADLGVGFLLGFGDGFANTLDRSAEVDDLALADPGGFAFTDAQDAEGSSGRVSPTTAQTFVVPISSPTMSGERDMEGCNGL